jgi:hypothetical protein
MLKGGSHKGVGNFQIAVLVVIQTGDVGGVMAPRAPRSSSHTYSQMA